MHVRRHVEPHEVDQPFIPRCLVQTGSAFEEKRSDDALPRHVGAARSVPSGAISISAPAGLEALRASPREPPRPPS